MTEGEKPRDRMLRELEEFRSQAARPDSSRAGDRGKLLGFVAEQAGESLIVTDLDFRITYVNRAFERLYGYEPGELIGRSPDVLNAEELAAQVQSEIYRQVQSGESWQGEILNRRKDGRTFPCELKIFPLTDEETGRTLAYAGLQRDLTEQHRTERELQASRQLLELFVRHTPAAVAILDREMRFLATSSRWSIDYNLGDRDLRGLSLYEVFPEIPARWREIHRRGLAGEADSCEEEPFPRADGTVDWVTWEIQPWRTEAGEVGGLILFTEVVTERKQAAEERLLLETRVQRAQKLESLAVMAGGIAHDVNNLLMGVVGNAELALQRLSLEPRAQSRVEKILDAARRSADLASHLVTYAGNPNRQVRPVDVSEAIESSKNLLEASVTKKTVLEYDLASELPAVEADLSQLRQVVLNLVTNASEALGEAGGRVLITTTTRDCDSDYLKDSFVDDELPAGHYVVLEVSDSGCGMDAETMGRIFDPFYSTKARGRGLGLAALLGIVRSHHGAVQVESEPAIGTRVAVLFPATEHELRTESRAESSGRESLQGSGRVLLADDEDEVRAVASRMLEKLGFDVITAHDGQEAVELFRRRPDGIGLVLLDLSMPRMGGIAALREIRRIRPGVPAVLSSGYSEDHALRDVHGDGVIGFLAKPYRLGQLRKELEKILGSS